MTTSAPAWPSIGDPSRGSIVAAPYVLSNSTNRFAISELISLILLKDKKAGAVPGSKTERLLFWNPSSEILAPAVATPMRKVIAQMMAVRQWSNRDIRRRNVRRERPAGTGLRQGKTN
jgi:hypothetical protein